jgi:hypothetical protein
MDDESKDSQHSAPPVKPRLKLDLDALPEQTSDDLDLSWGDAPLNDAAKQQRYLADKPPHHGD